MIPILQAIQNKYHYLPEEALRRVCEQTQITPGQIVSVASFYSQFSLHEAGEHIIKVCMGTACHVKGAQLVYDALERTLKLEKGQQTDPTGAYTLEKVHCVGCCALAPVVQIDSLTFGHLTSSKAETILFDFEAYQKRKSNGLRRKKMERTEGEVRITLDSCCVASGRDGPTMSTCRSAKRRSVAPSARIAGSTASVHRTSRAVAIPGATTMSRSSSTTCRPTPTSYTT